MRTWNTTRRYITKSSNSDSGLDNLNGQFRAFVTGHNLE